jgi:ATP synthase protein I
MTDRIPDGAPGARQTGGPADSAPPGASPEEQDSASIPPAAAEPPHSRGQTFGRGLREAAPYLTAASTVTGALLLGVAGGYWLDQEFGTEPWLVIAGTLAGLAVGLYGLGRVALAPRRRGPP